MIVFPNAKINLGLDIIRKRPDGYHDISTVMYPIPWHDILEIVPARNGRTSLTVTGRHIECPVEKNIVMKAYRAVEELHTIPPVEIHLHKVIPDGAGLGGGSADAAFTVKCLNELFSLGMTADRMREISGRIGADCPFFIDNTPTMATGIGTTFHPISIDLSGKHIIVVKPRESVPTAKAYSHVIPQEPSIDISHILCNAITTWQGSLKNDFEQSIFPILPVAETIKGWLLEHGADYASMSGSGSAVYGIFSHDNLSEAVQEAFPECTIFQGQL